MCTTVYVCGKGQELMFLHTQGQLELLVPFDRWVVDPAYVTLPAIERETCLCPDRHGGNPDDGGV